MDNNNIYNRNASQAAYQTFGKNVFWLFFFESLPLALALSVIAIFPILFFFRPSAGIAAFTSAQEFNNIANIFLALVFAAVLFLSFIIAWPNYKSSLFSMEKFHFKLKRGIFEKTEITFPYRLIQGVEIEQGLILKLFGLSRLSVLTGHRENKDKTADDFDGIVSAIDQNLAEQIKAEILKRANEQKTIVA